MTLQSAFGARNERSCLWQSLNLACGDWTYREKDCN